MKALLLALFLLTSVRLPAMELMTDPRVEGQIVRAEENVRLAEATERRIASQLEALQTQAAPDTNVLAVTSRYLLEVQSILATHRQTLADLRAIAVQENPTNDPVVARGLAELSTLMNSAPMPMSPEDELVNMDAEFEASLNSFDTVLLERMVKLQATIDARVAEGASTAGQQALAAADAAALLRGMGVDPGVPAPRPSNPAASSPGASPATGTPGSAGGAASGNTSPRTVQDEDIVARQLREAAEKETDPVLREKLWKEYEAYVNGRS